MDRLEAPYDSFSFMAIEHLLWVCPVSAVSLFTSKDTYTQNGFVVDLKEIYVAPEFFHFRFVCFLSFMWFLND